MCKRESYIIHRIIVILFLISNFFVVYMSNKIFTHSLPMRYADFPTLVDALDYAALRSAGMNFSDRLFQLEEKTEKKKIKNFL
ncbi:acyl-CoA synthetase [Escherichia coli]|nr:acyl-CoA synthetase [Escherichia coli]